MTITKDFTTGCSRGTFPLILLLIEKAKARVPMSFGFSMIFEHYCFLNILNNA